MQTTSVLDPTKPFRVPEHIGKVKVIVMNQSDTVPAAAKALMGSSPARLGLRIAGGCSNMSRSDRDNMLMWFGANLRDFTGFLSSGGTREVVNGVIDPMVTEVPALLAGMGRVITLSTVPRTGDFELVDDSRLQVFTQSEWGDSISHPNPSVHMLVFVQHELGDTLDWDGDVETYITLFNTFQRTAEWQFATIVWNGGGVTETEIKLAARSGWPVILVKGSGRAADKYVDAHRSGTRGRGHICPLRSTAPQLDRRQQGRPNITARSARRARLHAVVMHRDRTTNPVVLSLFLFKVSSLLRRRRPCGQRHAHPTSEILLTLGS
jgi:hypothetical protein